QLVASAVEGLRPENVTVVDADSNTPLVHGRDGSAGDGGADQQLEKSLLRTLEPVVGAEHVRASVHVDYDLSASEDTDEIYDPKNAALVTEQKSEETAGGALPTGVVGTASNLPGAAPGKAATLSSDSQSSRSESETYAVSKSVRHTSQPPGRIKRITAAVLVDDAAGDAAHPARQKRTPDELKQIEELAAAAIGIDRQRGDVISVENLSFQATPPEKVTPVTRMETARKIVIEWLGLLRYAGILALFIIVYFLMLRPVKRQLVAALRELPGRIAAGNTVAVTTAGAEVALPAGAEQARRANTLKKQLAEKVKSEPETASRLVESWM